MNSKLLNPNNYLFKLTPTISSWRSLSSVLFSKPANRPDLYYDKKKTTYLLSPLLPAASANLVQQSRGVLRGGSGYTDFAHGRYKANISLYGKFYIAFLVGGFCLLWLLDWDSLMYRGRSPEDFLDDRLKVLRDGRPKAKELQKNGGGGGGSSESQAARENVSADDDVTENGDELEVNSKKKSSFRDRKIIQYENRIRMYSTPDKVFRYFATIKIWNEKLNDYEIYMTPDDFIRSLTIGAKQPERLGLDSFNKFDPKMQKLDLNLKEDSVFKTLGQQGLISFSDYVFLTTLLSTPTRHFEIAFHMFDLDGNGNIDLEEFEQLQIIIRNKTSVGQRHKDTYMTGSVIKGNSSLNEYFFGHDLKQLLTADKFIGFQRQLQDEVIKMEFELCETKDKENGVKYISEVTFCEMILAYAGFKSAKMKKILKHIQKIYGGDNSVGILFEDYQAFFQVLRSIHDIDTALKFYAIAGASIDQSILKHVAKTVANVNLSDHLVEVVFNLFDENGDGKLSHKEFITVMKRRWLRGLQMPRDTGFVNFIEAVGNCTKKMIFSSSS